MIGSLSLAAIVAIVAVLFNTWNDYVAKALLITLSIMIHGLLALAFVSADNHIRSHADVFINTVFGALMVSFVVTIFSILGVLPSDVTFNLYAWLVGVVMAGGLATLLLNTSREDKTTRQLANASITTLVIMMIQFFPLTLSRYVDFSFGGGIYYRILIVLAIIFGVTAILAVIFHRLYRVKHPLMMRNPDGTIVPAPKQSLPGWAVVLIVIGVIMFGWPLISGLMTALTLMNNIG
ncbi:MAG: hypothetical protein LBL08_02260 [Candidatus Nomurabacteria bacterium]|jgi:hypothetical protein|nr:hypothetical protein [Candidatus Nomurabacteria bacterium]